MLSILLSQFLSKVNIERALKASSRNSGHFVQGHVDCTATIIEKWIEGDSLWVRMQIPGAYSKYIVPKGFVCIDGTSLTVCEVHSSAGLIASNERRDGPYDNLDWFTIMLVPHTQQSVIFPLKSIGDQVNIEVDVLGKMVETSVASQFSRFENQLTKLSQAVAERDAKLNFLNSIVAELVVEQGKLVERLTLLDGKKQPPNNQEPQYSVERGNE